MPSAKVLVVDDDPDIIEVLRIILESADYEVSEAFGPREAHAQVAAGPDLIRQALRGQSHNNRRIKVKR